MKRVTLTVLLLLAWMIFPKFSYGAFVNLDKVKIRITAPTGSTEAGTIVAENRENRDVFVKVYAMEWEYVSPYDGSKKFFPLGTSCPKASDWFRFFPSELTLAPGEKALIHYKITIPPDMKKPCYLVLFFETDLGGSSGVKGEKAIGLQFLTRIGTLFLIEPSNIATREVSLVDADIEGKDMVVKLKVEGNCALIGKLSAFIMDEADMLVARTPMVGVYAPPQETVEVKLPLDKALSGRYKVLITLQPEVGQVRSWEVSI